MPDDHRIAELVEEALASGSSPDVVCAGCPHLLAEVRRGLERCRRLEAELDAIFSTEMSAQGEGEPRVLPRIDGYDVQAVLGRGGVGVVYRAEHLQLRRPVAVKMLLAGRHAGRVEVARFLQEARAAALVRHPNIVQVYDVGETGGLLFYVMEFVDGGTLADHLGGVPQPAARAADLLAVLADAVEAAHGHGIVHRDLKPANVLLTAAERVPKIADFGLARLIAGAGDATSLTLAGGRIGTPSYMAPEQVGGQPRQICPATDVYALGSILYEMLTGRPPFRGESAAETERQLVAEDPAPPGRLNAPVPRDLETICLKCLRKDPAQRYATAAALADDLRRFRRGEPISARPTGLVERGAKWVRRHPAATTAAAAVVAATAAATVGLVWLLTWRAATAAAVDADLGEATRCQQRSDWSDARSALDRATVRLGTGGPAGLRARLDALRRNADLVTRLDAIRLNHSIREGERDPLECDAAYTAAFHDAGVADTTDDPVAVAARIRTSSVHDAVVAALDDWQFGGLIPLRRARWIAAILRHADVDPAGWRNRIRDPATWGDADRLEAAAGTAPFAEESPAFLFAVGGRLFALGRNPVPFLTRAQAAHPADFWLNMALGSMLATWSRQQEALRYYQAAIAVRPDAAILHLDMGLALVDLGRVADALGEIREGLRLDPTSTAGHGCLGVALERAGQPAAAIPELEVGVRGQPDDPQFAASLGDALLGSGRTADAIVQFRRTVALAPRAVPAWTKLRVALIEAGRSDEAIAAWRDAIRALPATHEVWDGYAEYHLFLGHDDEYRRARTALLDRFGGMRDAGICDRTGRACLLLPPSSADELARATAAVDRAVASTSPASTGPYPYFMFGKGLAEYRAGHFASAAAILRGSTAAGLQPSPRLVLAMSLYRMGEASRARHELGTAVLSADWQVNGHLIREQWISHVLRREAERLIVPDLDAVMAGHGSPTRDEDERFALMGLCQERHLPLTEANLWADTFAHTPGRAAGYGCRAAKVAAVASETSDGDAAAQSDADRARWRGLALRWIGAELDARTAAAKPGAELDPADRQVIVGWLTAPELASLRDADRLARLPTAERAGWAALWGRVHATIDRVAQPAAASLAPSFDTPGEGGGKGRFASPTAWDATRTLTSALSRRTGRGDRNDASM